MDREQEQMQFLGLIGIFKESFKIIFSWRKIFAQITLTLILPLTFIFLGDLEISNSLLRDIQYAEFIKEISRPGSKTYNNHTLLSEWITYLLFKVAYFTILLILSLLSTTAVVYTIASVYTGCELTFMKVMSIVPKVRKRHMLTFLYMFACYFVYGFILILTWFICMVIFPDITYRMIILSIVVIFYAMGSVYMTVIWQLASVVSVLECSHGLNAMKKSNDQIKGNQGVAIVICFIWSMYYTLTQSLFKYFVVNGSSLEEWKRVGFGVLCCIFLLMLFLFGLLVQTIIYLVCKSYHHENVDKEDLSNLLESYHGDYEPVSGNEVQLEQVSVQWRI